MQFVQDLVEYSIQNGSQLYINYLDNYQNKQSKYFNESLSQKYNKDQQQTINEQDIKQQRDEQELINEQFQTKKEEEKQRIKLMERSYKTIFVNPIQIKNQTVIQLLVMMRTSCGYDHQGNIPQQQQQTVQKQQKYDKQLNKQKQENSKNKNKSAKPSFIRPQNLYNPNILKWLILKLCKDQMRYTISQLLEIINSQDFLSFSKINLQELIIQKLKYLRSIEVNIKDLKKLMLFIPVKQFNVLKPILTNFLHKSHPSQILQLTKIIQMQSVSKQDEQYSPQYPRKQQQQRWLCHLGIYQLYLGYYFIELPQQVNNHYKYYSFQQNCYFLYYLLKNQIYWQSYFNGSNNSEPINSNFNQTTNQTHNESDNNKYKQFDRQNNSNNYIGEMEKLKQCVKIASYSRGFKLQMNSYFYKLLNYVDLVQFFQGGDLR